MRLVIGTAIHNNWKYTQQLLNSIKCSYPYEILVVNNGSADDSVDNIRNSYPDINLIDYKRNMGFSYAYNDAMDYALQEEDSLLLFCGNDIVFYPHSIDHMVQACLESDFEMFCCHEILDKGNITSTNPGALKDFEKYSWSFESSNPHGELSYTLGEKGKNMNHSCLIRKKSVFDTIGYFDINFYPAYFEDNDYARRCDLGGVKYGVVKSALYKHYWSRTIYEGGAKALNALRFEKNKLYYIKKWGGLVGQEKFRHPFDDQNKSLKIDNRDHDIETIGGIIKDLRSW